MTTNKYSLQQYIQQDQKHSPKNQLPSSLIEAGISNGISSAPVSLVGILGSNKKVEKFRNELTKDLQSPETIHEISTLVGVPLGNESEDQFVERSLSKIRAYLNSKFK
ncbi:hypothetical protein [Acinetobacter chinensis]|uniref:hypothetical protein n=1 Tax=Acinetobacter chinensis TaxID=2004650 RepID=UPI002934752B|nr:hypothetical protein [Acinetobacter chinensis]WOE40717.1 hypothetical protein QSG87_12590 [Acinetobacter chinensis]